MLDSSPVALPPLRPLKRSASVASLPTPPRTHRKRGRSRLSSDSESEEHDASPISAEGNLHKRRRKSTVHDAEDEEAFWMGGSTKEGSKDTTRSMSPNTLPDIPLLYRKRRGHALVSPPPSRRRVQKSSSMTLETATTGTETATEPSTKTPTTSPLPSDAVVSPLPVTPKKRHSAVTSETRRRPIRDSLDNPFLESPATTEIDPSPASSSSSPCTPLHEKPMLTYVFRGVRTQFANPLYDHANERPLSPDPRTLLPPEHEDFVTDLACPPKLLFPGAHQGRRRKVQTKRHANSADRTPSHSTTKHTVARDQSLSPPLDSDAVLSRGRDHSPAPLDIAHGHGEHGVFGKDRSNPIHRAMGPRR